MTELVAAPDIASVGGFLGSDIMPWARAAGDTLYKATAADLAAFIGAGAGSQMLLESIVTSGSQPSVTFAAIPPVFKHLIVKGAALCDAVAASPSANVTVQFNGDTNGAHYSMTGQGLYGGAPAGFPAPGGIIFGSGGAGGPPAGQFTLEVNDYTDATFAQCWNARGAVLQNDGAGILCASGAGYWSGIAAVTDILIAPIGHNWLDGCLVELIGVA